MPRYPQGIMVSCAVPWDENENVIEGVFRTEVRNAIANGFTHVYVFGTAGEGYAVDTARYKQIVSLFAEETATTPSVHAMVGVIGLSTMAVVERIAVAHDQGFREFQISLPSWGALNDDELLRFFVDVCGAFPDSHFLHYNLPRVKRVLTGADYARITPLVPNLVGTKTTGGELPGAAELMRNAPELQHFFGERNFPHGIAYGECSLLASWAWLSPARTHRFFEAARDGRVAEMVEWQHAFVDVSADVFGWLRSVSRMDGAYDKLIARLGGLEDMPLRLLSPYIGFTEAEYARCKGMLEAKHPDWLSVQPVSVRRS